MKNLTPWQIAVAIVGVLLAASSFINQVGSAIEKITKARKAINAPTDELRADVDELKAWRVIVDGKLGRDYAELKNVQAGNRAIFQALLALLDHGIDGNNIDQMQNAKTALQDHLIGK